EIGLKKGDRISVDLLNCPEFLAIYFASAKLGLIFVPLNCRMVSGELEYQLNNCGSRLLIFHDTFSKLIEPIRGSVKVDSDKFICLKKDVANGLACPEWATDFNDEVGPLPVTEPTVADPVEMDDPFVIIYTSGVTGQPKGAVLSHGQTYFKCFQIMQYTDMREDDVFLTQLPLFHSGGLFIIATPVLCRGASFIMRMSFNPEQFAQDIHTYKPTVIFALTTMWRFVLKTKALDKVDVSTVRIVLGGGERTPSSLIHELAEYGLNMQQGFGQTENSAMMILPKQDIIRKEGSIGLPGFFTDIWIEDEHGNNLPPGGVGEIVAEGPTVMSGYWNLPEQTAETIVEGRLHTGDLGYTDEEGYFYIVDRAKDMYRSGGENVYPAEVEKILVNHPKIENAAIIGVPDDKWGETGKLFVVLDKGQSITIEEVREYLMGKFAKYKFPSQIEILKSLPMTATGKLKKSDLKKQHLIN
ncbi:MAG: AMP-binding protein, partial [Desulfosarcina sp.]|nr:AMP-binding protein [Desulfobacterales bacterium]